MSKRLIRVLSLILTLVMFMSVSTQAFALGGGGLGDGWDRPIGEDEIRDFDGPVEEEEEPTDYFSAYDDQGLAVTVEAPMGALPTLAEVRAERVEAEDIRDAVDAAVEGNPLILLAVDISFWLYGQEIEPEQPVRVKIAAPELEEKTNLTLVHIPDEAEPETIDLIPDSELEFALGTNEIAFESADFSVYAILEGGNTDIPEQPMRATYEFYNADGTLYEFKDTAGITRTSQILKDGEILEDVGIPTKDASQNAKFVGWYVWNDDGTLGEKVEVGEAKTVTANEKIRLKAKMQGIVNVFFLTAVMEDDQGQAMSRSIVTVKQVEYTVGQTEPITVKTADVTTEAPSNEQAVVGWNRDPVQADAGTAEGTGDDKIIILYENGNANPIIDVMMYPAVHEAYWLYFSENDGGTGGGASYTPPQFVMPNTNPTKPADPHRTGYIFRGWYKDAACTQPFDFTVPMTQTTTVYAKWDGGPTTYAVVVWIQRTSDSASLPNNGQNRPVADRTYDFYKAYSVNSTTDANATPTTASLNLQSTFNTEFKAYDHIKLNRYDGQGGQNVPKVKADGSTVVNVYYDRDVMTIHFKVNQTDTTDTYATWYGLFDATFAESGDKKWPVINNIVWSSVRNIGSYYYPNYVGFTYTFLDSFKGFDENEDTELTIWQVSKSDSSYDYIFEKETLTTGSFVEANRSDRATSNQSYIQLSNKYTGFTLSQYRDGTNDSWHTATDGQRIYGASRNLYIRYTRNSYDLEFHNGTLGTEGTVIQTDKVKFEAVLGGHATPATPTYPVAADADHYKFIGWFADSSWKTLVSFTPLTDDQKTEYREYYGVSTFIVYGENDKMPAHNIALYAGYALKGWDCALNPNSGEFINTNQAGVFWLDYGAKFSSDIKTNVKREGYVFQGWMLANVPITTDENGEKSLVLLNVTTDANNHRFVGDFSNWTITDTPWQFDTGITGPTALMAKWFYKESIYVVYDAGEGSEAPLDTGEYADGATTVAFRAPVPPENKFFIGWDIAGTETVEKLQPGATFNVDSAYASQQQVTIVKDGVEQTITAMAVKLVAVYNETGSEEEVPVTHIDWYANNTKTDKYVVAVDPVSGEETKEDQLLHVSDAPLQINQGITIRPETTFKNPGYTFIGWAKLHDDNGTLKDHNGNPVAAATGEAANDMDYALTEENLYLKYEDGEFKVKVGTTWEKAVQVAADERTPYDDMYAVWELRYFYIYHSSDNTIEKIGMDGQYWDKDHETYNITAHVPSGYLYGGYYSDYDGSSVKADSFKPEDYTFPYTDASGTKYEPQKDSAVTPKFDYSKAYTASGLTLKPVDDALYFLKEVPAAYYLLPYLHYTYYMESNHTANIWLVSDIDDANYKEVGFVIDGEAVTAELAYIGKAANSLKITNTSAPNTSVTLKAADVFNAKGVGAGYLGYRLVKNTTKNDIDDDVPVWQYWVTPDSVLVTGNVCRNYQNLNDVTTLNFTNVSTAAYTLIDFTGKTGKP